jgi:hypothetical protein
VQDLILYTRDGAPLAKLLVEAAARFRAAGVEAFGVSAWDPAHWEVLEGVGLRPYARSVLSVWDTASGLPKSPNEKVRVEPRDPSARKLRAIPTTDAPSASIGPRGHSSSGKCAALGTKSVPLPFPFRLCPRWIVM